jgi:hypothetical protein
MPDRDELERLISVITVDCHDLSEQATAIYEAFVAEVMLPTFATVVGTEVDVVDIDIAGHGEHLIARCRCRTRSSPLGRGLRSRHHRWMDPRGLLPLARSETTPRRPARRMGAVLALSGMASRRQSLGVRRGSVQTGRS